MNCAAVALRRKRSCALPEDRICVPYICLQTSKLLDASHFRRRMVGRRHWDLLSWHQEIWLHCTQNQTLCSLNSEKYPLLLSVYSLPLLFLSFNVQNTRYKSHREAVYLFHLSMMLPGWDVWFVSHMKILKTSMLSSF